MFNNIFRACRRFYKITVLIAAGLFFFIVAGLPSGDSAGFNYSWTVQYLQAFGWNELLPRHLPGLWDGLGGYDFFFYGPLPFWATAALINPICIGCTPETQFILGAAIFWVLGGFTFYCFLRRYFEKQHAAIGAIAYAILPYHLWIDWFARQAVGEFAAYAFIPLIAIGFDAIKTNEPRGWMLSVGVAGTALCHLPTVLLAGHVFAVITLAILWQKVRKKERLLEFVKPLVGWSAIGVFLSCFYWLPALTLLDTVSASSLYTSYFRAEKWLFGLRFDQPNPWFSLYIVISFTVVLPVILVSAALSRGPIQMWIAVPFATALMLNLELSEIIWQNWVIAKVQFPWRMMVFVDFSAAVAITFAVMKYGTFPKRWILIILLLVAVVPFAKVGSHAAKRIINGYEADISWIGGPEYLSPEMAAVQKSRFAAKEGVKSNPEQIGIEMQRISEEFVEATNPFIYNDISPRSISILPIEEPPHLSVPLQYWFLWQAELEGNIALDISANPHLGTIDIIAPVGGFQGRSVTLTLPYHRSEKLGFFISLLSLLFVVIAIIKSRRKNQT